DYRLSYRILRNAAKRIFSTVFQNKRDSIYKALPALLDSMPLSICTWNFRAVSNKPFSVLFNNGSKFISHKNLSKINFDLYPAVCPHHVATTLPPDADRAIRPLPVPR